MKTHNWQTKALTLFIAAVALLIAAACGGNTTKEASPTKAPTAEPTEAPTSEPTETPTKEATQTPTAEPTKAPTVENSGQQNECTTESPELTSRLNTLEEEYQEHGENRRRANGVLYEHRALFWRQPNVYDVSESFLRDKKGEWTNQWGITVWVTEKVDQSTLPPGTRNRTPWITFRFGLYRRHYRQKRLRAAVTSPCAA